MRVNSIAIAKASTLAAVLAAQPEPAGYLLDQYLVAAENIGVSGLICLNKADLLDADRVIGRRARDDGGLDRVLFPADQVKLGPVQAATLVRWIGTPAASNTDDRRSTVRIPGCRYPVILAVLCKCFSKFGRTGNFAVFKFDSPFFSDFL